MSSYLQNFLLYYSIWLLSIVVCLFLGYTLLRLVSTLRQSAKPLLFLLTAFWIGFIALSTIYALVATQGKTILAGNMLIAIGYYWLNKSNANAIEDTTKFSLKAFYPVALPLLIMATIAYVYACFDYVPSALNPAPNYMWDAIVYSKQVDFLNLYGAENYIKDGNILPEFRKAIPYHYLELWNTAFLLKVTGLPSVVLLQCVTYQLLLLGVLLGLLAILEHFQPIRWYHYALTITLCFFGGIHFSHGFGWLWWYDYFAYAHEGPVFTYILFQKIYIPATFFAFAFMLLLQKKHAQVFIPLASLSLAYILFLPISTGFVILFSIWLWFSKQWSKQTIAYITLFMLTLAFAFIFYKIFGDNSEVSSSNASQIIIRKILSFRLDFKQGFGFLLNSILVNFPLMILIILLAFQYLKNNIIDKSTVKNVSIFFILYVLIALGFSIIFKDENVEYNQFYLMSFISLKWFPPALIFGLVQSNRHKWLIASIVIVVSIYHFQKQTNDKIGVWYLESNSVSYLQDIIKELPPSQENVLVACIHKDTTKVDDITWTIGKYLKAIRPYTNTTNLNVYAYKNAVINHKLNSHKKSYTASWLYQPFVAYVKQKHKKTTEPTTSEVEQYQLNFLQDYKIKYLLLEKDARLPNNLKDKIKRSFTDSISGERFCVLESY